jgi:RNA-directed DNA polymerase
MPAIFEIRTIRELAALAGVEPRVLTWLIWILPDQHRYNTFSIARRNGSERRIEAPVKALKDVQKSVADAMLAAYRAPAHVHGFTSGRSPKSNAEVHVDKFHVLRADLADFFPSITFRRVKGLFKAWPFEYPAQLADAMARLTCHLGALPQGAPTSPIISNFICRRMDRDLARLAAKERCHFSRYADDLIFSTNQHLFPPAIGLVDEGVALAGDSLKTVVTQNGFSINTEKTTLTRETQRQRVTGIVVNEKVNVPREYVRSLRSLLYIWRVHGKKAAETSMAEHAAASPNRPPGKPSARFEHIVRGRVQYVRSIKGKRNPTYFKLAKALSALDEGFEDPPSPTIPAYLYTEGPSDWRHLLAAQSYFNAREEYLDFELLKTREPSKEGHKNLRKYAEALGEEEQTEFTVCVFDSDVREAIDAAGPNGWKRYGPRVLAVGLARHEGLGDREPVFIEKLFADDVLTTKLENGRRLYLQDEFNPRTGHHRNEECSIPGRGKEFLQEKVYAFGTEAPLAISKVEFSKAVLADSAYFGDAIFEGFRPTFDRIGEALRDSWEAIS